MVQQEQRVRFDHLVGDFHFCTFVTPQSRDTSDRSKRQQLNDEVLALAKTTLV